jgi:hypothetical protein
MSDTYWVECTRFPGCRIPFHFAIDDSPLIADTIATICSGSAFTFDKDTPRRDGEVVPDDTEFTWTIKTDNTNLNDRDISIATGIKKVVIAPTNPTNVDQTITYTVKAEIPGTDCADEFDVILTVEPVLATEIFYDHVAAIDSTVCPNANITYTIPEEYDSFDDVYYYLTYKSQKWSIDPQGLCEAEITSLSLTGPTITINSGEVCNTSYKLKLELVDENDCQHEKELTIAVKAKQPVIVVDPLFNGNLACNLPPAVDNQTALRAPFTVTDNCADGSQVATVTPGTATAGTAGNTGCYYWRTDEATYSGPCENAIPETVTYRWVVNSGATQIAITATNADTLLHCKTTAQVTTLLTSAHLKGLFQVNNSCLTTTVVDNVTPDTENPADLPNCGKSWTWTASYKDTCVTTPYTQKITFYWIEKAPTTLTFKSGFVSSDTLLDCRTADYMSSTYTTAFVKDLFSATNTCGRDITVVSGTITPEGTCGQKWTWTASIKDTCETTPLT